MSEWFYRYGPYTTRFTLKVKSGKKEFDDFDAAKGWASNTAAKIKDKYPAWFVEMQEIKGQSKIELRSI